MADDSTTDEPGDEATEPATGGSDMASVIGRLGGAERLLGLGSAILVADYVLFGLIAEEYFFFDGTLLAAALVLFAMWVRHFRPSASWPLPYEWLLRVLGYSAGFLGLIELLEDLSRGVLDRGADVAGGLMLYGGALLMFWGARQVKGDDGSATA